MAGFDVESLAPVRGGRGAAKLGLKPLVGAWRDLGPELAGRAAGKAAIFVAEPDALIALPGTQAACAEVARLVGASGETLRDAALATFEDLCVLERRDGGHVFVAAALAYPTDWCLREKMGLPLAGIHAPVPGYAAKLAGGVDHVFETLSVVSMLTRTNWNIVETDALRYLPGRPAAERFGHVTAANAGETLWLRCERQVLQRLPETGAALFSIGVYRERLCALSPELVRDLAMVVRTLPEAQALRRGISGYRAALREYAESLPSAPGPMAAHYDTIGINYAELRKPDPRIASAIDQALGPARTILNVGAGTGSYEPTDRDITAVEPSIAMIRQRRPSAARVVQATADNLPFGDNAFEAAMAILTIHHWPDKEAGLREVRRVTHGRIVLLTFDPASRPWLTDYFPQLSILDDRQMPKVAEYARWLGPVRVEPLLVPYDCTDGFLYAYWRRPEAYLDPRIRSGSSSFWSIEGLDAGLATLSGDIRSGEWDRRYGFLRNESAYDAGYRLVIAEPE